MPATCNGGPSSHVESHDGRGDGSFDENEKPRACRVGLPPTQDLGSSATAARPLAVAAPHPVRVKKQKKILALVRVIFTNNATNYGCLLTQLHLLG